MCPHRHSKFLDNILGGFACAPFTIGTIKQFLERKGEKNFAQFSLLTLTGPHLLILLNSYSRAEVDN